MGSCRRRPGRGEGEGGFGQREGATGLPSPAVRPRALAGVECAREMLFGPPVGGGGGSEGVCKQAPPAPQGCSLPLPLKHSCSSAKWVLRCLFPWSYCRSSPIVFFFFFLAALGRLCLQVFFKKNLSAATPTILPGKM